jgi:hypothetical protein
MNVFLHCLWEVLQDPLYSLYVSPCDYGTNPPSGTRHCVGNNLQTDGTF